MLAEPDTLRRLAMQAGAACRGETAMLAHDHLTAGSRICGTRRTARTRTSRGQHMWVNGDQG